MRWFETELAVADYCQGEWDRAEQAFTRLDEWIAATGPHYMESVAHMCRALLRASRGDDAGAVADADGALDFARGSLDRQVVLPTLADCVLVAAIMGRAEPGRRVNDLVAELHNSIGEGTEGGYWACPLALGLALWPTASTSSRRGSRDRAVSLAEGGRADLRLAVLRRRRRVHGHGCTARRRHRPAARPPAPRRSEAELAPAVAVLAPSRCDPNARPGRHTAHQDALGE